MWPVRQGLPSARAVLAVLCSLLCTRLPAAGQVADSGGLEVAVIQGDGATNVVTHGDREHPVLEVRLGGKPLRGALVELTAPSSGPGGWFQPGGEARSRSRAASTGRNGRVTIRDFYPNRELGRFEIAVKVTYRNLSARTAIRQTNAWSETARREQRAKNRELVWLLAIGGVTVAVVAALVAYGARR